MLDRQHASFLIWKFTISVSNQPFRAPRLELANAMSNSLPNLTVFQSSPLQYFVGIPYFLCTQQQQRKQRNRAIHF
jgi:hypothetical protein